MEWLARIMTFVRAIVWFEVGVPVDAPAAPAPLPTDRAGDPPSKRARSRVDGVNVLAILAAIGGVAGLVAGLSLLAAIGIENGRFGLLIVLALLVAATAEIAFAYGVLRRAQWTRKRELRALAFVVAIALVVVGSLVILIMEGLN
jgi:hypothetical protein